MYYKECFMRYLLVLSLSLLLFSCKEEQNNGAPATTDQNIEEINQIRDLIISKWQSWYPEVNEKHTLVKNSGEINEEENDLICHYIYPQIKFEYTLTGLEDNTPTYLINRILDNFTLGEATTNDSTYCNENATKTLSDLEIFTDYLSALILLNLDRLPSPDDNPMARELTDADFQAVPIQIISSSREINNQVIGIYKLTYRVSGSIAEAPAKLLRISNMQKKLGQSFSGTLSITFATEVISGAFILSTETKVIVQDNPFNETRKEVLSLNGVDL